MSDMLTRIQSRLERFVLDEILEDFDTLDADENLLADGMIDSLGMVRLVAFIEEELNITVPPQDFVIENFQTLSIIGRYLHRHTGVQDG